MQTVCQKGPSGGVSTLGPDTGELEQTPKGLKKCMDASFIYCPHGLFQFALMDFLYRVLCQNHPYVCADDTAKMLKQHMLYETIYEV